MLQEPPVSAAYEVAEQPLFFETEGIESTYEFEISLKRETESKYWNRNLYSMYSSIATYL